MTEFFNDVFSVYKLFMRFLFSYTLSGISIGYLLVAILVVGIVIRFLIGRIK